MQPEAQHSLFKKVHAALRAHPLSFVAVLLLCLASLALAVFLALDGGLSSGVLVTRASEAGSSSSSATDATTQENTDATSEDNAAKNTSTIVVDVGGAVTTPGVVELKAGSRVVDAIQAAGGLSQDADTTSLNQAALVEDGQKILVPREGETSATDVAVTNSTNTSTSTSSSTTSSTLVNINTADATELDTLPGVGPATAAAIIDDRTQNGAFASVEDLMRVSGIGEKKFAQLQSLICV